MNAFLPDGLINDQLGHLRWSNKAGLNRDSNPGPLAPKARIIPLDHWAAEVYVGLEDVKLACILIDRELFIYVFAYTSPASSVGRASDS